MKQQVNKSVLIIDDEPEICDVIDKALSDQDFRCTVETRPQIAKRLLAEGDFNAVVCDVSMPGMSGLDLLVEARRFQPETPFILVTGYSSLEGAKQAIREGAFEYIEKPFDLGHLCAVVQQAVTAPPTAGATSDVVVAGGADGTRDALTGLATPRVLYEHLSKVRLASVADRRNCTLMLLDLDNFAEVNRMFGYAFGDEILRKVAQRICWRLQPSVTICRLGDDRFAVVLADTTEDQALMQAKSLCRAIREMPLQWQGHGITVSLSAGLAETAAGFALSESELLTRARQALKEAKRAGSGAVRAYGQFHQQAMGQVELLASGLNMAAEEAEKIERQLRLACLESVGALVSAVEAKDPHTRRHSDQVAYYGEQLARHMDLPGDLVEAIRVAALVHDVGKIGIPDTVLTKPGRLTDEEFDLIKGHPAMGANILQKISLLGGESQLVRYHHENWDGSGYPDRLAGEDIPLGARVIQVADAIDAMLMRRTYKEPFPVEKVLSELRSGRGRQFAPAFADAAVEWLTINPDRIIQPRP